MPKEKPKSPNSDEPVRTIRMPLCYTCGVALAQPGYCGNCLGQTERDLREFSGNHDLPTHPVNGDLGTYNGVPCVWVNGYWIARHCAPDWIRAKWERRAPPALTAEPSPTQLPPEKVAEQKEMLRRMDGQAVSDAAPF